MEILYMGTAAAEGWPAIWCNCDSCEKARNLGGKNIRSRTQMLINDDLLIDIGPDTYMHMLNHNLKFYKVKYVFITHAHPDHLQTDILTKIGGVYSRNMEHDVLKVYGTPLAYADYIKESLGESNDIKNAVQFNIAKKFDPIILKEYTVTPYLANHSPDQICFIYGIKFGNKQMLYANDTGKLTQETLNNLKGNYFDLVSFDTTFGISNMDSGHMGMEANFEFKKWLVENGCADEKTIFVCNHFTHNCNSTHEELEAEGKKYGFIVSYDGMKLYI